jgi:hypothetical protein
MDTKFPIWLALLTIIPFVVMSLAIAFKWTGDAQLTLQQLTIYAAIVFSFLAGIHWGLALNQTEKRPRIASLMLIESVVASILAWLILYIDEAYFRLLAFAFLYAIIWGIDSLLFNDKIIPLWFFNVRGIVTPIVVVSMYVTYFSVI